MKRTFKLLLAVSLFATAISASATTIGYWRFENAGNLGADSSGASRILSSNGSPSSQPLPTYFPTQIPHTGDPNTACLGLDGASGVNSTFMYRADEAAFAVSNQMTIEAYFTISNVTLNTTHPIAGQYSDTITPLTHQKSWILAVRQDTGNPIRLRFIANQKADGTVQAAFNIPSWSLVTNHEYYAAAVFTNGTAKFYLADLATGTPVLNTFVTNNLVTSNIFNSTGDFRIGAYQTDTTVYSRFSGRVDEVRWSDTALPVADLLYYLPGPPQIAAHPQNQSVLPGSNATFTVTAAELPPPPTYQWYSVSNSVTNVIGGATGSSLTVSNVTLSQSGNQYFVILTNIGGSVTSTLAALEVVSPAALTSPTVGYWRFESGGNPGLDSSTNAVNLSSVGVPGSAVLPAALSGLPGALFSKTIPLTGQTNISALALDGTGTNYLSHIDSLLFGFGAQMTVEGYFNVSNVPANTTMPIASQWNSPGTAGWVFGVRELHAGQGDLALRLSVDPDGTGASVVSVTATNWVLAANTDYYAAVVYNAGTVTFYLMDLSAPSPVLEGRVYYTGLPTSLVRGATDFRIGGLRQSGVNQTFPGLLDEVKISRVALSAPGLINGTAVPFPPVVDIPAKDLVVGEHSDATFTVTASSPTLPLTYQWYFGASPIGGATNTSYTVTNALMSQSGNQYSVVITNLGGAVTSGPVTLTVVDLSSPTIGYWRFEDQGNLGLDSSAAGLQLTNFNAPAGLTLPATNSGSPGGLFAKKIPLTSLTNTSGVQLDGASYLYHGDYPSFTVGPQMTVEAYFNVSSLNPSIVLSPIASQFNYTGLLTSDASWFFGIRTDTNGSYLRLTTSANGVNTFGINATNWPIQAGVDYYAAAVFNAGQVTLYLADLSSTNPALQSATYTSGATNLYNSSAIFAIGEAYLSPQQYAFPGVIDEVRLSRVALTAQQLLMPLPATGVPANLTATAGDAQVALNWFAVTNATSYKLKRSLTNGGPYTVVATLTTTNYVNTNLVNGTTYYYVVTGVGMGGESTNSTQAAATPVVSVAPAPTILPVYLDGTGTNLVLRASTVVGHNYILQSTPGLEGTPIWTPVSTNAGTGGPITNAVPISHLKAKEFFRYLVP